MKESINFCYTINSSLCQLAKHNAMKTGGKAEVQLHAFLSSTPDLSSGQLQYFAHRPPHFPLERKMDGHLRQSKGGSDDRKVCRRWKSNPASSAIQDIT
jgi:hypothetical protein